MTAIIPRAFSMFALSVMSVALLGQGSDSSFSRSAAKKMIVEKVEPMTRLGLIGQIELKYSAADLLPEEGVVPPRAKAGREKEISEGLINVAFVRREWTAKIGDEILGYRYVYEIRPTEKGAKYLDGRSGAIRLADREVIEVTGLTKPADLFGRNVSRATFTYKLIPTPFGKIYLDVAEQDKTSTGTAMFVLYDDGWRLEKLSYSGD